MRAGTISCESTLLGLKKRTFSSYVCVGRGSSEPPEPPLRTGLLVDTYLMHAICSGFNVEDEQPTISSA